MVSSILQSFLTGCLISLLILAISCDACFQEIHDATRTKYVPKTIQYKGCYPEEQLEPTEGAHKKSIVRLGSKICNEECKRTHPKAPLMGLGRGHCWCGFKSIGDQVANHNCNVDCPATARDSCGSNNFVSVYTTV